MRELLELKRHQDAAIVGPEPGLGIGTFCRFAVPINLKMDCMDIGGFERAAQIDENFRGNARPRTGGRR